jgi:hypothetical protein
MTKTSAWFASGFVTRKRAAALSTASRVMFIMVRVERVERVDGSGSRGCGASSAASPGLQGRRGHPELNEAPTGTRVAGAEPVPVLVGLR